MPYINSPLSMETIFDLEPFICGYNIDFRYEDGKCTQICGKELENVVSAISLEYKDKLLTDIEAHCQKVKIPCIDPNSGRHLPGSARFKYAYSDRRLITVDGALTMRGGDIIDGALHREYLYDRSGHLIQVTQNGEIIRRYLYQDNLLVQEKYPDGEELCYRYNDSNLVCEIITKKDYNIVKWQRFDFVNNKVVREFQVLPGNKWLLKTLHIHDWDNSDIIIKDNVTRYFYDATDKLNVKINIDDDSIMKSPFILSDALAFNNIEINTNIRNIELALFDSNQSTGLIFAKINGVHSCCQLLRYYKKGLLLKNIETAPKSHFNNLALLCVKPLYWQDICY